MSIKTTFNLLTKGRINCQKSIQRKFIGDFMKNVIFSVICLLLATTFIAVIPTDAESAVYEDTVRLHILANSDSEEDQSLKLAVRDAVLTEFSEVLSDGKNADDARARLSLLLPEIEDFCQRKIAELGYSYGVRVTLSEEWYDTREYESFTLPRGVYTSLRIIIGEGDGKNWWCVMYPPLCLDLACESAPKDDAVNGYSDEEVGLISNRGYNVKFKLLEVISGAFS